MACPTGGGGKNGCGRVKLEMPMWKRFILWDFPRASWQYDVIVALILAFIFLTPRDWFRDQPRIPYVRSIAAVKDAYFVVPETLDAIPENQRVDRLTELLRTQMSNKRIVVTRVEPMLDSEGELRGYMAFTRP
jgi:hypothetical protein